MYWEISSRNEYNSVLFNELKVKDKNENQMAYFEEQFEMVKAGLIMQFGETDGNRLFELQKKVMEIAEGGADEANMQCHFPLA